LKKEVHGINKVLKSLLYGIWWKQW
jgi:hypothetical protein